jgi:hypothetical protein
MNTCVLRSFASTSTMRTHQECMSVSNGREESVKKWGSKCEREDNFLVVPLQTLCKFEP